MENIKRPVGRLINVIYRLIDEHSEKENFEYFKAHARQAEQNGETVLQVSCLYALGYLCQRMKLYSYAADYYSQALNIAENYISEDGNIERLRLWIILEQGFLECDRNSLSESYEILRRIEQEDFSGGEFEHHMTLLYTYLFVKENDFYRVKKGAEHLLNWYSEYALPLRDYIEYSEIALYLNERTERELADRLIARLHEFSTQSESDEIRRLFLKTQMIFELYEPEDDAWSDSFLEFENLSVKEEKELLKIKQNTLSSREMVLKQKETLSIRQKLESMKKLGVDDDDRENVRARINEEGQRLFEHARLDKSELGIILMDIRDFMKYNQKYGIEAGDICISAVEDVLKSDSSSLFTARYGGDEFIAMFLGKNTDELVEYITKVSEKLKNISIRFANGNNVAGVTLYYGIVNEQATAMQTWSDYIHAVDNALYKAKSEVSGYCIKALGD